MNICVCSGCGSDEEQRAPSVSAAESSRIALRALQPRSDRSCLQKYISPLFCFNTLDWSSSSILFLLLFGSENGKHNKTPKIILNIWRRRKDSKTQHPEHNSDGMSSYCHSPREDLAHGVLPEAATHSGSQGERGSPARQLRQLGRGLVYVTTTSKKQNITLKRKQQNRIKIPWTAH